MLAKKYHAIVFIGLLVMLLLLGLHLLGIGYTGSGASAAKSAALARNSSQTSSSSNFNAALTQNQPVYRHPIVYDKLTGATNNQINDVLGAKLPSAADYPIDHYQQQQLQLQRQQQQQDANFNPLAGPQDDFLFNLHNQQQHPALGHPLTRHMSPHNMRIPQHHHHMMTTQPPGMQQQFTLQPMPPPPPPPPPAASSQRQDSSGNQPTDSLSSASSLSNNTSSQQQQQQQSAPIYYTPPIFAYNNFDQGRPLNPMELANVNGPFGYLPAQTNGQRRGQQVTPMVPEAPLTVDEYNARQSRLRQQPLPVVDKDDRYASPNRLVVENQFNQQHPAGATNLLADPQQQQRHRQQMLDQQLLFGNAPFPANEPNNLTNYYPDPALLRLQGGSSIRPPYASGQPAMTAQLSRPPANHRMLEAPNKPPPFVKSPARVSLPAMVPPVPVSLTADQQVEQSVNNLPSCARQHQAQFAGKNLEDVNASLPVLFCNDDPEYPTNEVMRALEVYANEKPLEQLLPQQLVQIHLSQQATGQAIQQQLSLDSLQPSINLLNKNQDVAFDDRAGARTTSGSQLAGLFPSASYEPLCKSTVFMGQPRRAKNLLGQWKVVVNLPGHKYRGVAISQMVRVEECSRPNGECSGTGAAGPTSALRASPHKSRCLQHYENQRLVAWSAQQGLHLDIFRVPIACSCHIRK